MKLYLLKETEDKSKSSAQIFIKCAKCSMEAKWNDAAKNGWMADVEGKSFRTYYCNKCVTTNGDKNIYPTK